MKKYNSYKDSGVEWIGEIPRHWIISKFKYETKLPVQYGINSSSDNYIESGTRFIRTTDIINTEELKDGGVYLDENTIEETYFTNKYDFLVSRSGTLGRTYIHLSDERFTYGGYLVRFNFGEYYLTKFLGYFSNTKSFDDWIELNTIVSTIGNVNGQKYNNLPFTLPPLHERQQIVQFLDTKTLLIDSLFEKTQRKIELLKEKRTSLINHVVTKGLNPNVEMKDSGVEWIGEIPGHYETVRLKFLCSVTTGNRDTQDKVDDGSYPFYVRSPKIERINSYSFDGESVLTVGDGVGTGKVFHYVTGKFEFHQRVYKFSDFRRISGKFFFWFIKHHFIFVTEDQNSKSTVDSLRRPLIDGFQFVVPPISEQQQIIEYLDEQTQIIDTTIIKEQKRIELLKEYRQSLISEVVTGKQKVIGR
jgi:type I restriction enzyme, S subunit